MIRKFKEGVFIHGVKYYDMKLLEKIRGKIMSWMLVCENWGAVFLNYSVFLLQIMTITYKSAINHLFNTKVYGSIGCRKEHYSSGLEKFDEKEIAG